MRTTWVFAASAGGSSGPSLKITYSIYRALPVEGLTTAAMDLVVKGLTQEQANTIVVAHNAERD